MRHVLLFYPDFGGANKQQLNQQYWLVKYRENTRVVYHGVTSSFFCIGILPVSDLLGGRYFRSVLLATIVQSGQQKQRQQRYVSYFQRQFWDTNHLMYQCIMFQFLCRLRYLYEYILNSYFQSLAASFFDIRSQGVSKVSCTNSCVDLEICMTVPQTDSMCCWQHHFWHMNIVCCHWYHIPIPTQNHKFV